MTADTPHEAQTWTVGIPSSLRLITSNHRLHWAAQARATRAIRHAAKLLAKSARIPALPRAKVVAEYRPADRRRRDPANWYPSVKAAIDGLVDAGVLPDDDAAHLLGPDMRLGAVLRPAQLFLHIHALEP